MMTGRARAMLCSLAMTWVGAASAFAQDEIPRRPYPAIFGGAIDEKDARQNLEVSLSLVEAYDSNLTSELERVSPSMLQTSGAYTAFSPNIRFQSRRGRTHFGVTGDSEVRYYDPLQRIIPISHALGVGIASNFGRHTSYSLDSKVTYAPAFFYNLFAPATPSSRTDSSLLPVGEADALPAYSLNENHTIGYDTTANISHGLSRRTSLSLSTNYHYTVYDVKLPFYGNASAVGAAPELTYTLTPNVALGLSYRYQGSRFAPTQTSNYQEISARVDYSRARSATRRTTLSLSAGQMFRDSSFANPDKTVSGIVAEATATSQLTRTWVAKAFYRRGAEFVGILPAPVITNSGTFSLNGFLNRRTDLLLSGSLTTGRQDASVGFSLPIKTYTADLRLRFGLTAQVALLLDYLYYFYRFSDLQPLPPGIPTALTRNAVRAGLTWWVPVWRRR